MLGRTIAALSLVFLASCQGYIPRSYEGVSVDDFPKHQDPEYYYFPESCKQIYSLAVSRVRTQVYYPGSKWEECLSDYSTYKNRLPLIHEQIERKRREAEEAEQRALAARAEAERESRAETLRKIDAEVSSDDFPRIVFSVVGQNLAFAEDCFYGVGSAYPVYRAFVANSLAYAKKLTKSKYDRKKIFDYWQWNREVVLPSPMTRGNWMCEYIWTDKDLYKHSLEEYEEAAERLRK